MANNLHPSEITVKRHYENLGYYVESHGVLDFMVYKDNERICVEVKTPTDKLSEAQVSVAELLALLGVETRIALVVDDTVHCVPLQGLANLVEELKKTNLQLARDLGKLMHMPAYEFEPTEALRNSKRALVDRTMQARGIERKPPLRSPFLFGAKPKRRLQPQQLLGKRTPFLLWS